MKFNINDDVKVKLTPVGFEIHRKYWAPYTSNDYIPPRVDDEGYSTFQLWDLMVIFGSHIHMWGNNPFETEIIL
jgi:hypothetical protein